MAVARANAQDAENFVHAFGLHATFTVRFVAQDKQSWEKSQDRRERVKSAPQSKNAIF